MGLSNLDTCLIQGGEPYLSLIWVVYVLWYWVVRQSHYYTNSKIRRSGDVIVRLGMRLGLTRNSVTIFDPNPDLMSCLSNRSCLRGKWSHIKSEEARPVNEMYTWISHGWHKFSTFKFKDIQGFSRIFKDFQGYSLTKFGFQPFFEEYKELKSD